ncbi:hypothetical protein LC612_08850 [Nostoc sp. CHAB 5834]|nr:hypothetical protein [Nostoc sp. CHAB 5834]
MATRSQRQQSNLALVQNFIRGIYIYNIDRQTANTYGQLKAALQQISGK